MAEGFVTLKIFFSVSWQFGTVTNLHLIIVFFLYSSRLINYDQQVESFLITCMTERGGRSIQMVVPNIIYMIMFLPMNDLSSLSTLFLTETLNECLKAIPCFSCLFDWELWLCIKMWSAISWWTKFQAWLELISCGVFVRGFWAHHLGDIWWI